ncbi:MAG: dipeptidase [Thermoanaerobaculia bacterium]
MRKAARILPLPIVFLVFATVVSATPAASAPDAQLLERAKALLAAAPLIDTHNDLPTMLLETNGGDLTPFDLSRPQSKLCADVPRLHEGRVGAQFWSIWVDSGTAGTHTAGREALREFDVALRFIRATPEFELAKSADDIERIHREAGQAPETGKSGHIAALLGVEGGHMIENSAASLRIFYELGARYMTLTHWDTIDWADAATDRAEHDGLTELGEKFVGEMNRLGMFVDISHVSAETMRDVLRVSKAPVIFSHSNSFAIDPHPRNVPDDVLASLAKNGGVISVNFINDFVSPADPAWQARRKIALEDLRAGLDDEKAITDGIAAWEKTNPHPKATIADVADHIDHIRKVAGIDHIGIGSDFYSVDPLAMVQGLDEPSKYPDLFAELLRRGYSDEDVQKIAGRNLLRAMHQMERVATELQKTQRPLITDAPVAK